MPAPISPSTTETAELQAALPDGESGFSVSVFPASVDPSMGSVVWGAVAPLAPFARTATERRFKFRGLPRAVGAARRALREWERHFEPDTFYDLSLCVSELVTNTVQHGELEDDEIELVVRRGESMARAEVRTSQPDVAVASSPLATRSDWGLFIVDRVADRWGVDRSRGMAVWCEIDLASDGWSRSTVPVGAKLSS
jgi:anti-sigma regulatory factor (Ser/Thr protein kinase)